MEVRASARPATPLDERVRSLSWYHTIELPDGLVTPGRFDTRPTVRRVPLPASLAGKRCLDIGTWDGFWAFEMERRGGEVVAVDIEDPAAWDWPPHARLEKDQAGREQYVGAFKAGGRPFDVAKEALGSAVERVDMSIYDLDPERLGVFDFVFIGTLLMHLRDPVAALNSVRGVCGEHLLVADAVDALGSLLRPRTPQARLEGHTEPWWWIPNVAGLRRIVASAGFGIVAQTGVYTLPFGPAHPRSSFRRPTGERPSAGRRDWPFTWLMGGLPHSAVLARPLSA